MQIARDAVYGDASASNPKNRVRAQTQNTVELRKLNMYLDKIDKMKNSLEKNSDREKRFVDRTRLRPVRDKNRILEMKEKLERQEERTRLDLEQKLGICGTEVNKHNSQEPYGRWVRLPSNADSE